MKRDSSINFIKFIKKIIAKSHKVLEKNLYFKHCISHLKRTDNYQIFV